MGPGNPHPDPLLRGPGCEVPVFSVGPSRERRGPGVRREEPSHFRSFPIIPRPRSKGGEPWPHLALFGPFTPSGEAGNEATVASVGPPLTRRHWASWPWLWPWLASSGVARSGETFNSVAFGCIWLLSLSSTRGRDASFPPSRERRVPSRGWNDACRQCRGWRGDGAMGSCRWLQSGLVRSGGSRSFASIRLHFQHPPNPSTPCPSQVRG